MGTTAAKKAEDEAAKEEEATAKKRKKGVVEEEPPLAYAFLDSLPPIYHFDPVRSVAEAARDYEEGGLVRVYREGISRTLDNARKWLLADHVIAFEAPKKKKDPTGIALYGRNRALRCFH